MAESPETPNTDEFLKAKDLVVVINFERDESYQGVLRSRQAKRIICELILLGRKRGRPSKKDEVSDEAA